ncbi:MAG: class I SAM-dependent methyltransferase [Candidatus Latescibacterota bacterium]|jgi:SAM-dependent methyltransferase
MSRLTRWVDKTFYPNYPKFWDDLMLRNRVLSVLTQEMDLLDLGAGRGNRDELDFSGACRFVAGVDLDEAVLDNPYLTEARLQAPPDFTIPYEDQRFDLVVCNNVLEHVERPGEFFTEVRRVLKPGGIFIGKTPNRHHYVPFVSRLLPQSVHVWYNELRGREAQDTFPVVYACNTDKSVRAFAAEANMDVSRIDIVEGRPEYLRLTFPSYLIGLAYERTVNASPILRNFRGVLIIELRKPD